MEDSDCPQTVNCTGCAAGGQDVVGHSISPRDSQQPPLTSGALPCLGDVCLVVYHRSPTNKHIADAFQYGTTCSARIIKHSPRNQYLIPVIVFHFNKFFFELIKMKNYSCCYFSRQLLGFTDAALVCGACFVPGWELIFHRTHPVKAGVRVPSRYHGPWHPCRRQAAGD